MQFTLDNIVRSNNNNMALDHHIIGLAPNYLQDFFYSRNPNPVINTNRKKITLKKVANNISFNIVDLPSGDSIGGMAILTKKGA